MARKSITELINLLWRQVEMGRFNSPFTERLMEELKKRTEENEE